MTFYKKHEANKEYSLLSLCLLPLYMSDGRESRFTNLSGTTRRTARWEREKGEETVTEGTRETNGR